MDQEPADGPDCQTMFSAPVDHGQTDNGNQNHSDQSLESFYKSVSYIVDCLNNCLDTIDCNSALNVDPELPLADADLVSLTLDLHVRTDIWIQTRTVQLT